MIDYWFPCLIYNTALDELADTNQHLVDLAYSIKSKNPDSLAEWRCDTYSTMHHYDAFSDNDPIVHKLINTVQDHVESFAKEYGMKSVRAVCTDFWFNIAGSNSYQEYHQHAHSHFSVAYYISVNPDSGNIVFKSHETLTDMYTLPIVKDEYNHANYKTCYYKPSNNKLLIFRSNLLHMVEKNLSGFDRIGVSMNFDIVRNA
jgi:uncharacterized protein (TIGR02466 family)